MRSTSELIAELERLDTPDMVTMLEVLAHLRKLNRVYQAVEDHASEHSPVNDDIRSFCKYLLETP